MGLRELEMNKYFIALIGFFTIFMSSCTYTNPGFPEELKQYLPYEKGQVLTFKNADSTRQYTINELRADKEDKYAWNCKCSRDDAALTINAGEQFKITIQAFTEDAYIYDEKIQIWLLLNGIHFNKGFTDNPFSESIVNDIGDTIMIANELGNVTIVRNKGITEYTIEGAKWTLVE